MIKKIFTVIVCASALLIPDASQPSGSPELNEYLLRESKFIGACQATFVTAIYLTEESEKYMVEFGVDISEEEAAKLIVFRKIMTANVKTFSDYFIRKYPKQAHLKFSDVMAFDQARNQALKEQLTNYSKALASDARSNEEKASLEYAFSLNRVAKGCAEWFNKPDIDI